MKNKELRISESLSLPLRAVTEKLDWLGRTGSGKTYGASKLAEEMFAAGAQIVALDPVGVWYGLRSAADGKAPGMAIPIFGGLHGDVPLEPTGGALMAELIVSKGVCAVIDVSQFEHDSHKARFAEDFAAKFFFLKKSSPGAVHLFIEECQEFMPQNPAKGEERMLHAFQRLWKLGRNFGIGGSLITQRPQEVSKKTLNMAECLFAFQMTGPQERKAIDGWVSEKGLDQDIAADLPKLAVGECHVWSPAWLKVSEKVKIAPKWTLNASSTPAVGGGMASRQRIHLAEIDLAAIREQMAATIELAKANDPGELKRKIKELEKELNAEALRRESPAKVEEKVVEVPLLTKEERKEFDNLVLEFRTCTDAVNHLRNTSGWTLDVICEQLSLYQAKFAVLDARLSKLMAPVEPRLSRMPTESGRGNLPIGEEKVLAACIQFPDGITRQRLTILTAFKRSTRDAYIARLRERGFVVANGDMIAATAEGVAALPEAKALPNGKELQEYWLTRLPEGERRILNILLNYYPDVVSRETISEETGFKRSTRDAYLSRMSAKMLFTEPLRGTVRAAEQLF